MKQILLFTFIAFSFISYGQHPSCDGSRYLNTLFVPDTTLAIQYGSNTTQGGTPQDLFLDFFEPSGDVVTNRPLIILAFGGSFIGGAREDMHSFCAYYASKGYACATIDYRLYDGALWPLPDSVVMTDEVIKAVSDMKASIRFFREDAANANTYRIDPNLIFVGGISAGSIVGLHTGLLQQTDAIQPFIDSILTANGGWTGNSSNNTQYADGVAGILNYSGALKWATYVDANDPPIFSVHDDQDGTVPYATGSATIFGFPIITLQGSSLIHANAQTAGVTSELITIPNSTGHVSYFNNANGTDTILARSLDFLYPLVCGQLVGVEESKSELKVNLYPNPANEVLQIELNSDFQNYTLRIVDIYGREVYKSIISDNLNTLNIASFAKGNYIIELMSNDQPEKYTRQQFVKL